MSALPPSPPREIHLPPELSVDTIARLVDALDLPIGRWDRQTRLTYCNPPYLRWAGRDAARLIGRTLAQIYGDTAWAAARNAFAAAFSGRTAHYERRLTHQGASARWARVQVFPVRDRQGQVEAVCTVAVDIHDDVVRRESLEASRRRLNRFTDHIPYPLTYVDRDFVVRFVNRAYVELSGQAASDLIGRHIGKARGEARWAQHRPYFERALAGEPMQYTRLVENHPSGPRWLRTSYVPDRDEDGTVMGAYTVTVDVHELAVAQERLRQRIERDELTGALSRRTMMDRIEVAAAAAEATPVGLFFIDLDGFKQVNDVLGHAAGDRLLAGVAQALQQAVRAEDAVGRFGGDEFLVLALVRDVPGAQVLGQHLLEAVRDCCSLLPGGVAVSASIGVALAPSDAGQPMRLLQLADESMYAAKRAGKNRVMHIGSVQGDSAPG